MTPEFLTLEDALEIHAVQLERFGGGAGLRNEGLLRSALAQPEATAFGDFLHTELFDMAAAYLFHVVSNHPFVDGNKRTGLLCALVFLDLNGVSLDQDDDRLYEVTMAVAQGRADKARVAETLRAVHAELTDAR